MSTSKFWVFPTETPPKIEVAAEFATYVVENPETFGLTPALVANYADALSGATGAARDSIIAQIEADEDILPAVVSAGWVAVTLTNGAPKFHAANLRKVREAISALRDAGLMSV